MTDHTIDRVTRVLEERLRPAVFSHPHRLDIAAHVVDGEPVPVAEGLAGPFTPTAVGAAWGRPWGTTWFHVTGRVPASFGGRRVEAVVDLGFDRDMTGFQCEGLVYRPDGTPVRGLHPQAQWVPVAGRATGGEDVDFYVEGASNPVILDRHPFLPTSLGDIATAHHDPLYRIGRVDLCVMEEEVFELVHDVEVLLQLAQALPDASTRRARILRALDRALDLIDLQDVAGCAAAARGALADVLAAPATASAQLITAVGHSHIDSAWLWPLRETVRKVARTASSMVTLLDEHPEFVYAMSSAQQYAWLRDRRPAVFARVKEAVAQGRFVPVGGMWVESDAVLPSGEALIRQIAYGQRFFREEFDVECQGAWLPDSFGYSGALPQILRGAGFEWFLTQKMSWNEENRFPFHTFDWEGIDGTRIFTHFPPIDTYAATLSGEEIARATAGFAQKAAASSSLAPTGYGDGGGGTTREMIARAARLADLEGSARVRWETPDTFFARAKAELPDPPVWRGELYLEKHRGTYTSQHAMKHRNRMVEQLLRQAELWAATAAVRVGAPYPYDAVDAAWREALLLQFHDILPGSAIAWVHREARDRYARLERTLGFLIADALGALGVRARVAPESAVAGEAASLAAVSVVHGLPGAPMPPAEEPGQRADAVPEPDAAPDVVANPAVVPQRGVPAGGVGVPELPVRVRATREEDVIVLQSAAVRIAIDDITGHVFSAVDRETGRDAIPDGMAANAAVLHQDFPARWDAWDVDASYRGMSEEITAARVVLEGETVIVHREFGASRLTERLSLAADGRTLQIDVTVDWHETEKFLKLAWPLDVFTDHVTAETQFGHHDRPVHTNTSWDAARFEQHTQRWFLLSEPGFGVAFLNDSTYGFDVERTPHDGHVITVGRFSLLRAPRYPDPQTDQGVQHLRLGIVIGTDAAGAAAAAERFTAPLLAASGASVAPLVTSTNPAIVVSAVKLADDRSGDLVVRVYEARGGRASGELVVDAPGVTGAVWADLLERSGARVRAVQADGGVGGSGVDADGALAGAASIRLDLRPFQIQTVRLRRAAS